MEQKKSTKYILIAISVLFIFVMLILPLFSILFSALKEGFAFSGLRVNIRHGNELCPWIALIHPFKPSYDMSTYRR